MTVDPSARPRSSAPGPGASVRAVSGSPGRPRSSWRPAISVTVLLALLLGGTGAVTAGAAEQLPTGGKQQPVQQRSAPDSKPSAVPLKDRSASLGAAYRASTDRAWTTTGDADGLHLLVADEKSGYAWRTAATLMEPGFDTDAWIGNACVTASGKRAVVVYGPRTFTNTPTLFSRGGFTAVVDLQTGKVRKLPIQASLAYYNPGCGSGESAVLTQSGGDDKAATRLIEVDAATATSAAPIELTGQVTSAVPVGAGVIAAADSARIVRITRDGRRTALATANSVPYNLRVDRNRGVVFLDRSGDQAAVHRVPAAAAPTGDPGTARTLATGKLMDVGLTATANGTVFITGTAKQTGPLPATVRQAAIERDAQASTDGTSAVLSTRWSDGKDSRIEPSEVGSRPVDIDLRALKTGHTLGFRVDPTASASKFVAQGGELSPALRVRGSAGAKVSTKATAQVAAAGSPTNPVEDERYCSVPRNDPRNQAMQPKPRQVEWAVDQAITGNLNSLISRPANWKNLGMPAYQPQTLFPRPTPAGGGRVPAQVMLGITAQESNLWQASRFTVPGVTGNPLIGNFYGVDIYDDTAANDWSIVWADADCGYGITQVTDHMRLAGHEKNDADKAWAYQTQRAVALDYTVNVAAGLQILVDKWNQTRNANLTINNGDIAKPENWFYAIWAYNSGFHPQSEAAKNDGAWGVGWANNPGNPEYPANRYPFMEYTYADAAHPERWPYPEKVLGFAGHPPELLESPGTTVAAYRAAWWNGDEVTGPLNRQQVKPPVNQFCNATNQCVPGQQNVPNAPEVVGSPAGPCGHKNAAGQYDLKCWYNQASTWKPDCGTTCGNELLRFDATYAEQADGTAYSPNCSLTGLPSNALVIDELASGTPSIRPGCGQPWTQAGTFQFTFASDGAGLYPSKIDTHQLGAGFGGHFYFSHTRTPAQEGGKLKVTGTWRLNTAQTNKWERILVHLPDHGAHTQQAAYKIDLGSGSFTQTRYINQKRKANNWVSLGVYKLTGVPRVQLSTETDDGTGDEDVAFDAVAFQPLPAKPKHIVAVLGDSYTSGEGAGNYLPETDTDHGTSRWNACRRSKDAWGRRIVLPGTNGPLGTKADNFDTDVELGFVACSGARTSNVWNASYDSNQQPFHEGEFNEQKQVVSGVLTSDTTLVMLTLGGNDGAGFTQAMIDCSGIGQNCNEDPNFLPTYKAKTDTMINNLRITLVDIAAKAPNARIVLMGYPELLSRTVKCAGSLYFNMPEVAALATLVNYADDQQKLMVDALRTGTQKLKTEYANPVADFVGHAGCDDPEWINKIVTGPVGDGDFHQDDPVSKANGSCTYSWLPEVCLSRASFHPKVDGTGDPGYAGVMRKRLVEIGYTGS